MSARVFANALLIPSALAGERTPERHLPAAAWPLVHQVTLLANAYESHRRRRDTDTFVGAWRFIQIDTALHTDRAFRCTRNEIGAE